MRVKEFPLKSVLNKCTSLLHSFINRKYNEGINTKMLRTRFNLKLYKINSRIVYIRVQEVSMLMGILLDYYYYYHMDMYYYYYYCYYYYYLFIYAFTPFFSTTSLFHLNFIFNICKWNEKKRCIENLKKYRLKEKENRTNRFFPFHLEYIYDSGKYGTATTTTSTATRVLPYWDI